MSHHTLLRFTERISSVCQIDVKRPMVKIKWNPTGRSAGRNWKSAEIGELKTVFSNITLGLKLYYRIYYDLGTLIAETKLFGEASRRNHRAYKFKDVERSSE